MRTVLATLFTLLTLSPIRAQEVAYPTTLSGTSLEILGAEQAQSFADNCGVEYGSLAPPKPLFHDRPHVLLTGHKDFNRRQTKAIYAAMQAGGASNLHLMDLSNFAHELPRAKHLTEAIEFLDTPMEP